MPTQLRRTALTAAIILAVTVGGIYFRLYPITVNLENQKRNFARLNTYLALRKSLAEKVAALGPAMPENEKAAAVDALFRNTVKNETANIEKLTDELTRKIDPNLFRFFLLEADPYHYYHLTKELLKTGRLSPVSRNGKYLDQFMLAPDGYWRPIELHPYLGALTYRVLAFFRKDISVVTAVAMVPLILFTVSAVVFVLMLRLPLRLRAVPALIGGLLFALSPIYAQRSSYGWYDTDPYNVIFPLCALYALVIAFRDDRPHPVAIIALGAISALYAFFWQGWLFLPLLVLLSCSGVILYRAIYRTGPATALKKTAFYLTALAGGAMLFLTPKGCLDSLGDITNIFSSFFFLDANLWPDIFITVGELKRPPLAKIMHMLGGPLFFWGSLAGAGLIACSKRSGLSTAERIVLTISFVISFLFAANAERFSIFLLGPAAVMFACAANQVYLLAGRLLTRFTRRSIIAAAGAALILAAALPSAIIYAHATAMGQTPIYNAVWEKALDKIRTDTPPESIVSSWWCPGHFLKAVAERRVTFDGATLNMPQSYWIASFFMTDNEAEALGILRMLNTSGNRAAEFLIGKGLSFERMAALIRTLVRLDKPEAFAAAQQELSDDDARSLLALTHGETPPSYVFLYNDLIDGVLGLYFVKNWDFRKALELRKRRLEELDKGKIFWRGSRDNIDLMWSIANGPVYIGQEAFETARAKDLIYFANGVMLNPTTMEARITGLQAGLAGQPHSVLFVENGELKEKLCTEASLRVSVLIIRTPEGPLSTVIAPAEVLRSILFRLYYLGGAGLTHFERFDRAEDPALNTKIIVYRVRWQ